MSCYPFFTFSRFQNIIGVRKSYFSSLSFVEILKLGVSYPISLQGKICDRIIFFVNGMSRELFTAYLDTVCLDVCIVLHKYMFFYVIMFQDVLIYGEMSKY